jgi:hypothetical protein
MGKRLTRPGSCFAAADAGKTDAAACLALERAHQPPGEIVSDASPETIKISGSRLSMPTPHLSRAPPNKIGEPSNRRGA